MRIGINTRLLIENRLEGIGWFTYETLSRITKQHPEHQFYFFFDRPFSEKFLFSKNITPVVLNPPARHPILWFIWFEYSIRKALNKYKIDLFVSPDGYLCLSSKVKQIAVIHDINFEYYPEQFNWSYRKYLLHYFQRFAKQADRIITVSNFSKQDIVKKYQISPDKIDVAYNGSNVIYRPLSDAEKSTARQKFAKGENYFIYIGALSPRKNVSRLLEAFDEFKKSANNNVKLVIVGAKLINTADIERAYKLMEYYNEVIFTNRLGPGEIEIALGGAIALLYVSYFEGFGIPIIEAMNANVPVITSNVTSMPEVAGDAAILIDPFSTKSISDAMNRVYSDEALRKSLIDKGRIRKQVFNWDKTAEQVWSSIEKCFHER